jgi:hypothetical protein
MFGFLDAHGGASTFLNFIPDGIPFARGIQTTNIPTEDVPHTIIHKIR